MKTYYVRLTLNLLPTWAALFAVSIVTANVAYCSPQSSNLTGVPSSSADVGSADATSNGASLTNELYRIITDNESGQYAHVETNRDVVILKEKTGHILWSTNVVNGLRDVKKLAGRKVVGLRVRDRELWVDVGRGFAILDLKTGGIKGVAMN